MAEDAMPTIGQGTSSEQRKSADRRDDDRRHEERPFDSADRREEDRRSIVGRRQVWPGRVSI